MIRIATLGPAGTNHELVTNRYMAFRGIERFDITFVTDFADAVSALRRGDVDLILQCAVHPQTAATMGAAFKEVFVVDSFIADSQELGVLSRRDVAEPRSIALLMPSTSDYTDLSRWERHVNVPTLPFAFQKLLDGEVDSALCYTRFAKGHEDLVQVDETIGSPDDVWIVYGRERVSSLGGIVADRDAPIAAKLRDLAAN